MFRVEVSRGSFAQNNDTGQWYGSMCETLEIHTNLQLPLSNQPNTYQLHQVQQCFHLLCILSYLVPFLPILRNYEKFLFFYGSRIFFWNLCYSETVGFTTVIEDDSILTFFIGCVLSTNKLVIKREIGYNAIPNIGSSNGRNWQRRYDSALMLTADSHYLRQLTRASLGVNSKHTRITESLCPYRNKHKANQHGSK